MLRPTISIDTFASVDIRVGLVREATPVPDSKKLIKLVVELGDDYGIKTILTGMLPWFPDPSVLVGKKYLFLTNLEPRAMAGIESQGMFLACDSPVGPTPVSIPDSIPLGAYLH